MTGSPPYIVSVFLAFAIAYLAARTPGYHGGPFAPSLADFVLQFFYLGPWFNVPWINGVAWTLAIEFQYYVAMLIAAPLLFSARWQARALFLAAIVPLALVITDERALFVYLPAFAVGFSAFLIRSERVSAPLGSALCVLFALLTAAIHSAPAGIAAGLSGALMFVPLRGPIPALSFLGTISYSLYLVHTPIGDRVINLAMRIPNDWLRFGGFIAAVATSILTAIALWYLVERPWQRRSRELFAPKVAGELAPS